MNSDVAAQKAFDRLAKVGFERLTEQERILATVWTFDAEIANRGFAKYYSRPAGDPASFAPTALTRIGAVGPAEIARKANNVLGRKARREIARRGTRSSAPLMTRSGNHSPRSSPNTLSRPKTWMNGWRHTSIRPDRAPNGSCG